MNSMKLILKWFLGALGFAIGVFALMLGLLAGGGMHLKYEWGAYLYFSILLPFLTPYAFIQVLSYKEVVVENVLSILKVAIFLDVVFIALMLFERAHLPIFSDLVLMVTLWCVWQLALVIAYFLKVSTNRKD